MVVVGGSLASIGKPVFGSLCCRISRLRVSSSLSACASVTAESSRAPEFQAATSLSASTRLGDGEFYLFFFYPQWAKVVAVCSSEWHFRVVLMNTDATTTTSLVSDKFQRIPSDVSHFHHLSEHQDSTSTPSKHFWSNCGSSAGIIQVKEPPRDRESGPLFLLYSAETDSSL